MTTTDMQAILQDAMRVIAESADEIKAGCAIDDEWPDAEDKAEYDRRVAVLERVRALSGQSAGVPEGRKLVPIEPTAWRPGSETPSVKEGKAQEFIIAVRRAQSKPPGKVFVFAANYANNFTDDGSLSGRDGGDFTAHGWYLCGLDTSGEFDEVYEPICLNEGDEIVGWQELPKWQEVPAASPAPASEPEQPSQDEADLCERIIHAVEGECDGLAITEEQASNILAYLQYGAPMRDMPEAFHIVDNAIGATENYEPEGGNLRIVTLRIDAARKVRAALASALQAEAAQEQVGKAEPIAWIRFCGDGLYEGPIMNCDRRKMDEIVRVKPDEWRALVLRNDSTQENGCLTRKSMQEKALEHGFEYWRAPDEHGITGTKPQCIEFLQDLLGVEVEIEDNGCQTCNGTGMIGGPSFYAPDEGGEPCPDCCDTPSYCSSVRRCTSQDAEQPSDCGEQDCPHGVDDGACKQCYSEATRSAKGYSKEWCMRMAELEPEDGIPPIGIAASAPTLGNPVASAADRRRWEKVLSFSKGIIDRLDTTEVMRSSVSGTAYDAAERAVFIRNLATEALSAPQPQAAEPKGLKEIAASFVDWELVERMRSAEEIDSEEAGMLGAMIDSQAREIEALRAILSKGA